MAMLLIYQVLAVIEDMVGGERVCWKNCQYYS